MLSLIYSCGLRCGELLSLQAQHIDSKRNIILIKNAKGKKDRIVPLSLKILAMLREYYQLYKPKTYLFEGQKQGEPYDARSLQLILKQAIAKAGISKAVTLHWLGTVMQLICLKVAPICDTFKNFLGILAARQLKFILM